MARPVVDQDVTGGIMAGLGLRVLSAAVMIPIALYCLVNGGQAFAILVLLAALAMIGEWHRLIGNRLWGFSHIVISILTAVVIACGSYGYFSAALFLMGLVAIFALIFSWRGSAGQRRSAVLGVIYICLPCLALLWLRLHSHAGLAGTFWLFGLVWAADTGAYFTGRIVGGPKLAPKLSPKKTWAGLAGGITASAIFGLAIHQVLAPVVSFNWVWVIVATIAIALVAELGDLVESGVKRAFSVKDTSNLIPGHGGVLDRLDSMLFAAPVMAAVLWFSEGGSVVELIGYYAG